MSNESTIQAIRTIKRYSNRKLYCTEKSAYINLEEIAALTPGTFQVLHHNTKMDITVETYLSAIMANPGHQALDSIKALFNI